MKMLAASPLLAQLAAQGCTKNLPSRWALIPAKMFIRALASKRSSWDQQAWGFTITDCVPKLREGDPVVEVLGADNPSLVPAVREGIQKPNKKERKEGDRPYRAGFDDD
jgi:hypothetical protein